MKLNMIIISIFFLISNSWAQTLCSQEFQNLPTLAGGRVKPLVVLAEESFRFITGKNTLNDLDPTVAFCQLSFEGLGIPSKIDVPVKVEHVDAKKLLGLKSNETSILMSQLALKIDDVRVEYQKIKENNSYKKELSKILSRGQTLDLIRAGQTWTAAEVVDQKIQWLSLSDYLTEEKVNDEKALTTEPIISLLTKSKENWVKFENDNYLRELTYHKSRPFFWALILAIISLGVVFWGKWKSVSVIFCLSVVAIEIYGMTLRILISGRAPITNMYETVMFSGFGALVLAIILFLIKKENHYLIGGLVYNSLCLMMMKFANNMLDPSISPLVPVLRDNFWLSTHVTTIILSYAALALSWIMANVSLVQQVLKKSSPSQIKFSMEKIYSAIKVGVVLLSAGIILGGVWADYSWGRFWGWDPKETWSLIVLLIYMAILHGRYTNWINAERFIPLVAAAFMSVMMAWFGVNYILATGLHSYGFSEGGAIFLGSFFLTQILVLVIWLFANKKNQLSKDI